MAEPIAALPTKRPGIADGGCAITGAAFIASLILSLALGIFFLVPFVMLFTVVIALAIGLPTYLVIRQSRRINWLTVSAGGFVTGGLGPALLFLRAPLLPIVSTNGIETVSDGAYTAAGWIQYLQTVTGFGIVGVIGAMIAWYLIALQSRSAAARRYQWPAAIGLLVILTASAAMPWLQTDRSCHNVLRDGRSGIAPVASFSVHRPKAGWPALQREIEAFGRERGWSVRSLVEPDSGWFEVNLCTEPGTDIAATNAAPEDSAITILIYQPQGGTGWSGPFHALDRRIAARWPGSIVYPPESATNPPWAVEPPPGNQAGVQR